MFQIQSVKVLWIILSSLTQSGVTHSLLIMLVCCFFFSNNEIIVLSDHQYGQSNSSISFSTRLIQPQCSKQSCYQTTVQDILRL